MRKPSLRTVAGGATAALLAVSGVVAVDAANAIPGSVTVGAASAAQRGQEISVDVSRVGKRLTVDVHWDSALDKARGRDAFHIRALAANTRGGLREVGHIRRTGDQSRHSVYVLTLSGGERRVWNRAHHTVVAVSQQHDGPDADRLFEKNLATVISSDGNASGGSGVRGCNTRLIGPGAELERCDLAGVSLARADLVGSNLSGARLDGADLTRADLRDADVDGASWKGTVLDSAVWIDGRRCSGDSTSLCASDATLDISQNSFNSTGADPKVLTPFYVFGQKYTPNTAIPLKFYLGNAAKGTVLATTSTPSDANGGIKFLAPAALYGFQNGEKYTVTAGDGGKVVAQKTFQSLGTPTTSPTLSMFGFTSMCKPDATTGQFRITNNYSVAVNYTLRRYSSGQPTFSGTMPPSTGLTYDQWSQYFQHVPWADAGETWILSIEGVGEIGPKAVGNNNICS